MSPTMEKVLAGVLVPIPTLPFVSTVSIDPPVEETMENGFSVLAPWMVNLAA